MPTPFMCHECDGYTMNTHGICDNCIEPTTADEYNKELFMVHDPGDEHQEQAYQEGEKNTYQALLEMEKKVDELEIQLKELLHDLAGVLEDRDELRKVVHMVKELAMLRDNYGMIESVAEEGLEKSNKK